MGTMRAGGAFSEVNSMIEGSQDNFTELGSFSNHSMADFRNSSMVDSVQRGSITSLSSFKTNGLPTGASQRSSMRNSMSSSKGRGTVIENKSTVKEAKIVDTIVEVKEEIEDDTDLTPSEQQKRDDEFEEIKRR